MRWVAALVAFASFLANAEPMPFALGPNDPAVVEAAESAGLDPALVYAVALVESGVAWTDGQRRPSPYVMRIAGQGIHAESLAQIREVWDVAEAQSARIEDVGPMQINLRWHGSRVNHPQDLLDPAINLRVGAAILRESLDAAPDLITGIGRYHHSTHSQRTAWYAGQVLRQYRKIITQSAAETPVDAGQGHASR